MDLFDKFDIEQSIQRIEQLLKCGIFHSKNSNNVLFRAAFIELLIALRDLMYKAEKYTKRISFDDDILKTDKIKDVTDVIKHVRDAICHPDSQNHYIDNDRKASFNVAFGKGVVCKINDYEQRNNYDDDICFFFGSQQIYMKRHISRAFDEAKSKLLPLLKTDT